MRGEVDKDLSRSATMLAREQLQVIVRRNHDDLLQISLWCGDHQWDSVAISDDFENSLEAAVGVLMSKISVDLQDIGRFS